MMVVLSLVLTTLSARPRSSSLTDSSLRPNSSVMTVTAGQDGDVLQHGFATVAEARGLDGSGLQDAADVVDHQGRQCFAFNFFSDDQQRLAGLGNAFQYRQHFADVGDFLVDQQDEADLPARPPWFPAC